jgi:hypothetical protein
MNPILHNYIPQNYRDELLMRMGSEVFWELICSTQDNLGLVLENLRDISPLEELIIRIWGEFEACEVDEALAEAKKLPQSPRKPYVRSDSNDPRVESYCNGIYEGILRRAAIHAKHAAAGPAEW